MKTLILLILLVSLKPVVFAQPNLQTWQLLDLEQNGVYGTSADHTDIDSAAFYPNAAFADLSGRTTNMLTVGAISSDTTGLLTTIFSNYGQKEVDLFAPGVTICSTIPGNKYVSGFGTSYAGPMVAGVATAGRAIQIALTILYSPPA